MTDFLTQMKSGANLSEAKQRSAGTPIGGDMTQVHKDFVRQLSLMIERGEIDATNFQTFLNPKIYDSLDELARGKVDVSVPNIASLLTHIIDFYKNKETPDACPQLQTMIDQLWEMKQRVEDVYGDVFVF